MSDAAHFQHAFGAMLFGQAPMQGDPALTRALAVHRNTSAKAAQDALADNFPVVRALVGKEPFAAAAADFIEHMPPVDPRLCFYGAAFPTWLGDYEYFAGTPYLADVATVEWHAIEALFAADQTALDGAAFTEIDLDRPLKLHPAARHLSLPSPAGSIWLAHATDKPDEALKDIEWAAEVVLVTRPTDTLIVTVLSSAAAGFLDAACVGRPLGEAAAACGDELPVIFAALIGAGTFA